MMHSNKHVTATAHDDAGDARTGAAPAEAVDSSSGVAGVGEIELLAGVVFQLHPRHLSLAQGLRQRATYMHACILKYTLAHPS